MLSTLLVVALAEPLPVVAPTATTHAATWKTAVEPDSALLGGGGVLVGIGTIVMAQAAVSAAVIEGQIQQDEDLDSPGYAEHQAAWDATRRRWMVGATVAGVGAGAAGAGAVLRFGVGR